MSFKQIIFTPPSKKEHKITLNLKQINPIPPIVPIVPITKPIPKVNEPIVKKEVSKQKYRDTSKKVFAKKSEEENNTTKVEIKSAPIQKIVKKKKIVRKKVKPVKPKIKKRMVKKQKRRKHSKDPLANMLMGSGSSLFVKNSSSAQKNYGQSMIKQLYGKSFESYSAVQKKFIRRNLGTIHKITQRTLTRNGYPEVARRTKQQGTNIVSFYLHPNGDISNLRLKRPIGYTALDENTLKVIRIAYKDYPLPNQKTKIIFYVNYRMY